MNPSGLQIYQTVKFVYCLLLLLYYFNIAYEGFSFGNLNKFKKEIRKNYEEEVQP